MIGQDGTACCDGTTSYAVGEPSASALELGSTWWAVICGLPVAPAIAIAATARVAAKSTATQPDRRAQQ